MHTYKKTEEGPWTVGFDIGGRGWHAIADFDKEWKAARFTNYLNGGLEPRALLAEIWPIDQGRDWP